MSKRNSLLSWSFYSSVLGGAGSLYLTELFEGLNKVTRIEQELLTLLAVHVPQRIVVPQEGHQLRSLSLPISPTPTLTDSVASLRACVQSF